MKLFRIIGKIILVLLAGWVLFGIIMFFVNDSKSHPKYPLGYLDGIDCGMKPASVIHVLGEPKEKKTLLSNEATLYSFDLELDGAAGDLGMFFTDDRYLYLAAAKVDAGSPENADRLAALWKDRWIRAYEKFDGVCSENTRKLSETCYEIHLDISNGAIGASMSITVDGQNIEIRSDFSL